MRIRWSSFLFGSYLLFLVFGMGTFLNPVDSDIWHRFAVGDLLLRTGHFPVGETFSYLADYHDIADHEWGSALIFYPLYVAFGGTGLVLFKLGALALTLALTVRAGLGTRSPTAIFTGLYAVVLLALLPSFLSTVRCMLFTHILFALWIVWFQRERQGCPVRPLGYILTMLLWANLHGGFVIGLAWLATLTVLDFFFDGLWRARALLFFLCVLVTLINPFGYHLWEATLRALFSPRLEFDEWGPVPWIHDGGEFIGFKLLLLWGIPLVWTHVYYRGWKGADRYAIILLGLFCLVALRSSRQTSIFALVAGSFLPALFPPRVPFDQITSQLVRLRVFAVRATLLLIPFFMVLRILPGQGLCLDYPSTTCPKKGVDYLRQNRIQGRLLVPFNYGSYALWQLRGQMLVSMDGRYDLVYAPKTFRRVANFFAGKDDSLLTTPFPDAVLIPSVAPEYARLKRDPAWREVYGDDVDAVFLPRVRPVL